MNNETPKAVIEKRKRSKITWIIPIIALLSTFWLINKSIEEAGVNIIVNFKNGNGFKAGKTAVVYKGYTLGKVTKITVGEDLNSVNANINISKEAENFITREGTEFWIVKPKFSVNEISGLDTIISGVYIEVKPKSIDKEKISSIQRKYRFTGLDEKPFKYHTEDSINITLQANDLSGINEGTPIFYKKFKVGEVIATQLLKNSVKIFINVQKKYKDLINTSTIFWNVSGVKLNASLSGVNLEIDSLVSLFSGGITFKTFDKYASKDYENHEFFLYDDLKGLKQDKSVIKLLLKDAKGIQKDQTPILYKGIEIGKIKSIILNDKDEIIATAFIDKRFSNFNKKGTKFYKVEAQIGLMEIKNVDTVLKGNYINVIPGSGEYNDTFTVYASEEKALKKQMYGITIKSDKLYNLKVGSNIFYKNVVVGSILGYDFTPDLKDIIIKAGINTKYKHLINDKTLFYSISTPLIESKNFDLRVNFEGVDPLINGGIGIEYTKSKTKNFANRFWLYDSFIDLLKVKQKYSDGKRIKIQIDENTQLKIDAPLFYRNIKIGFIESFDYLSSKPYAVLFIENNYKKIINSHTKFYLQSAINVNANLSQGLKLKLSSFETLLKGGIVLTNNYRTIDKNINTNFKYKLYDDFENLPIEKFVINLTFKDIEGLDTKNTKLMYKGIQVGKITNIKLNENLNILNAKAYIYDEYKEIASKNSIFYIVKPDISLSGISGFETIIKGSYINILKGDGLLNSSFDVYNNKPISSTIKKGLKITLNAIHSGSLTTYSNVYYKKIKVGEIENIDLDKNSKYVNLEVFIYDKYKNLIRKNSKFYNVSGIDIDVSLVGATIRADSLSSVVLGGISFATPDKFDKKAKNNAKFTLYQDAKPEWLKYNPEIILE